MNDSALWRELRLIYRVEEPGRNIENSNQVDSNRIEVQEQEYRTAKEAERAFHINRAKVRPDDYVSNKTEVQGTKLQARLDALRAQYKSDFDAAAQGWQQMSEAQKIAAYKVLMAIETKFYNDAQKIFDEYDQYKVEREILVSDLEIELPTSDPTVYFDDLKLSMRYYDSDTISTQINGMGKIARKGRGFVFRPDANYRGKIRIAGQRGSFTIDQLIEKYGVVQTPKMPEREPDNRTVESEVPAVEKQESESGVQKSEVEVPSQTVEPQDNQTERRSTDQAIQNTEPLESTQPERGTDLTPDVTAETEQDEKQPVLPKGITRSGRTFSIPFDRQHHFTLSIDGQTWDFDNPYDYTSGTSTFTAIARNNRLEVTLKNGYNSMQYSPIRGTSAMLMVDGVNLPSTSESRVESVTEVAPDVAAELANLSAEERDAYEKWLADGIKEFTTDRSYPGIATLTQQMNIANSFRNQSNEKRELFSLIRKYETNPALYGPVMQDVLAKPVAFKSNGMTMGGPTVDLINNGMSWRGAGHGAVVTSAMRYAITNIKSAFIKAEQQYKVNTSPDVFKKVSELDTAYAAAITEEGLDPDRLTFYQAEFARLRPNLNNPYIDKSGFMREIQQITAALTEPETERYSEYRIFETQVREMQETLFSDDMRQQFMKAMRYTRSSRYSKERQQEIRDSIWTGKYEGVNGRLQEDWNMLLNIAHQMPGTAQERVDYIRDEMPNLLGRWVNNYNMREAIYYRGGSYSGKYGGQRSNGYENISSAWRRKFNSAELKRETLETFAFNGDKATKELILHPGQQITFTTSDKIKRENVRVLLSGMSFLINDVGHHSNSNTGTLYADRTSRGYLVRGMSGVTKVKIEDTGTHVIVSPVDMDEQSRWDEIRGRRGLEKLPVDNDS